MSRKKKADKKQNNNVAKSFNQTQRFNDDQLTNIIAAAILKAEEQKRKEEERKHNEEWAEIEKKLGYKNFSKKPFYVRWLFEMIEGIRLLILQTKKDVMPLSSNRYTKLIITLILGLMLELVGIILMGGPVWITVCLLFNNGINFVSIEQGFVLGLISFVVGILFILSAKEIICTKDSNFVFSTFSAMTSVIAIAIAIVALVLE